jgi:DUF4097 and DUF4098 domain-containing protein YvlB
MDARTIEFIEKNAELILEGSVIITGSIGERAKITVKNGSLFVHGSVEARAEITLINDLWEISTGTVYYSYQCSIVISDDGMMAQRSQLLKIDGDVKDYAQIAAQGNASIEVNGLIGNGVSLTTDRGNIKTKDILSTADANATATLQNTNGNITCGNINAAATLSTANGNIRAGRVHSNAALSTMNGKIHCQFAAKGVRINVMNGKIKCDEAEEGAAANIKTINGKVIIAGKVVYKPSHHHEASLFNGSVTIVKGQVYRRVDDEENRDDDCCGCIIV